MLSTSIFRNAAALSVKRTVSARLAISAPMTARRAYATESGEGKTEQTANEESKNDQVPKEEETKVQGELSEEAKKLLAEKDKKISELQDAYLRCLADQENLRERSRREIETTKEFAIQKFAKDLLDTVDILNMALNAVPTELRSKSTSLESEFAKDNEKLIDQLTNLYTGVSMTEAELIKALKRHGVERVNPEGEAFDPNQHQALFQAPIPGKEAGTIFSVQKMGYTLKGRIIRPAQVGVVADAQ
ncbi:Mitochondrial matrix cochaperone [Rhizopus azygosporus]|uniref:GrpE protein homolog n=1 Tax=Rhizopus azygosporus TaxID=86630 RepID=A0A367KDC8_RHIAZ|nr:Mitochondrial matrix cochaperone [Rhizopus azygosporus]